MKDPAVHLPFAVAPLARSLPLVLPVLALVLAACDPTVGDGGETVQLQPRTRTATFSFPCDGAAAGEAIARTSTAELSFGGTGDLDGFAPSDVTAARVTSATLVLRQPSGTTLGALLTSARVTLVGAQAVEVAVGASLPAGLSTSLVTTGADLSALLRAGSFRARLDGVIGTPRATECRFDATLTYAITVRGL